MSGRYAFVTLISSDSYLPGALAVAAALREVHPTPPVDPEIPFQIVCLVTPETVDVKTIKHLRRAFDSVIGVEVIEENTLAELQLLGRPDLHTVLTKLHVFRLTQFDKIIYLDADVLPIRPLSHLFTLPHEFSAVPDVGWPDIFNSGVMVFSPGEDKFNDVMKLVKTRGSWDGGDQGVLNEWRRSNWNRLSFTYNTTPTIAYTYAPAYKRFYSDISALHFIGTKKPWDEIPYRAPSSASQNLQQTSSEQPQQAQSQSDATSTAPPQSYGYGSLMDRWFDVYDRNYRQPISATQSEFESKKYENAWDDATSTSASDIAKARTEATPKGALGLEDLRKLAIEGGSSASQQTGEGEYRSLPLEGRIDLMRPKHEPFYEAALPELHAESGSPSASMPSDEHVQTPTIEQPHWQGHAHLQPQNPPTPGPNEIPPSPYLAPQSLPPSSSASPALLPQHLLVRQDTVHIASSEGPDFFQEQQKTERHHSPPAGEPPRPNSPPLLSWNPAIEPPPNVPPTPSAFPSDAYFPNAWDLPPGFSSGKPHDSGSISTSQLFEPPPQTQIPRRLIQEGHYRNVMGQEHDTSQQPDMSKVISVFPWEGKPRHIPGRVFPQGESAPPGVQYIENLPPTEPEQESELLTPEMTQEERAQAESPQIQFPSPPASFSGARGYSNAWDAIPSIQKYAARLVKPSVTSLPLTLPTPHLRKRADSYRSRGEQSDANSMDGDVEDEVDDDDSEVDATGRFSSSERSNDGKPRRSSKSGSKTPPLSSLRTRTGKREYRSYGVQTVPKDVRSIAVQVSQETSTSIGKSNAKSVSKAGAATVSSATRPYFELPKQPAMVELQLGPEPTALATPSSAHVESFIRPAVGRQQQHGTSTGMLSPRLHDAYTFGSPSQTPPNGTQTPVARGQPSVEQPAALSYSMARTSSQETADSSIGPTSPIDSPPATQSKKPSGRKWNPATGVDVFKRNSEEVLARFLRLGSWEDDSHSPTHAHG